MNALGSVQAGRQRSPHHVAGKLRPYLRVANVQDAWIDFTDVKEMAFTDKEAAIYELRSGDIRLSEGQSLELVGRPAIYRGELPGCCFQNTLVRLRPEGHVPDFVLYVCQYLYGLGVFQRIAKKTTSIAHLGVSRFAEVTAPVPPLPEQRKIADILSTWDEALEKLDTLIQAKERLKKALMQQLLTGKKRVKGFSEPWITCKLGELFRERVEQGRSDLPLLSITANRGVISRGDLTKRDTSSEDKSKYLRIVPGDIGYNTMRMWQGVSALSAMEGIVSPAYTICAPTERINGRFTAHFFKHPHTIHLFHRYSQGLVDDTLNLKFPSFAVIDVTIPSDIKEQRVIAKILDTCDEELHLLGVQRENLDQQKRGLMQRLLTGNIRVKTPSNAE
jgi:type I restriction enzyme, S subunit